MRARRVPPGHGRPRELTGSEAGLGVSVLQRALTVGLLHLRTLEARRKDIVSDEIKHVRVLCNWMVPFKSEFLLASFFTSTPHLGLFPAATPGLYSPKRIFPLYTRGALFRSVIPSGRALRKKLKLLYLN